MLDLDMRFVSHATEIEYTFRMREVLRSDILSDSDMDGLSQRCFSCLFSFVHIIQEVET